MYCCLVIRVISTSWASGGFNPELWDKPSGVDEPTQTAGVKEYDVDGRYIGDLDHDPHAGSWMEEMSHVGSDEGHPSYYDTLDADTRVRGLPDRRTSGEHSARFSPI